MEPESPLGQIVSGGVEAYGPWAVIAMILTYLFAEIRGLKGRVRRLEGLEVIVERFRNFYEIARASLLASCEFHRAGDKPTQTQLGQWERTPSVEDLMRPRITDDAPPKPESGPVNPEGDETAGHE